MENWERTRGGKEDGIQGLGGPVQSLCVYGNSTVNHIDLYNYHVLITILKCSILKCVTTPCSY